MSTFTKHILSESVEGAPILISGTESASATLIHTAPSDTLQMDEVWLYAMNTDIDAHKLTIEWGGDSAGNIIVQMVPAEAGLVLVAPGLLALGNDVAPIEIKAFNETTGDVINITGYVNRITEEEAPLTELDPDDEIVIQI